jgi:hypothetical protein
LAHDGVFDFVFAVHLTFHWTRVTARNDWSPFAGTKGRVC